MSSFKKLLRSLLAVAVTVTGLAVVATPANAATPSPVIFSNGVFTPTSASISWTDPAGKPSPDNYVFQAVPTSGPTISSVTMPFVSKATTYTNPPITLTPGVTYTFQVVSTILGGSGGTVTTIYTTAPSTPVLNSVTSGNTSLTANWSTPTNNGGSAVTSYTATATPGGATCTANTAASTNCTINGLTNGTSYSVAVTATNVTGTSAASNSISGVPATVPGAPSALAATSGNAQASLTWTAPVATGGAAITDYVVEFQLGAGAWTVFNDGVSTTASATVTGLTNGSAYNFRVSAVNSAGTGTASTTASATPASAPSAPTNLVSAHGNNQVSLTWTAAAANGSVITDYVVEFQLGAGTWTVFNDGVSATASAVVTGLTNGSTYNFRVSAVNALGTSPVSTTATDTPATTPDAPASLTATPGDTQVVLTWTAPVSNGGSAITGYNVEVNGSVVSTNLNALTYTATGLTNGTLYSFNVYAVNAKGTSVAATATATPAVPVAGPSAPQNVTVVSGRYRFVIDWTAPASEGSSAITGYTATANNGTNSYTCTTTTATRCIITGLPTSQFTYSITVRATNTTTPGTSSNAVSMVSWFMPAPPSSSDLRNMDLAGLDLSFCNLGADLSGVDFGAANLTGAFLKGSNVTGTVFAAANLAAIQSQLLIGTPASLPANRVLRNGALVGAGANLWGVDLSGANLSGISLVGANLGSANLTGANLTNANLTGVLAQNTNFSNVTALSANLTNANITGANVAGATLTGATMVNLRSASVAGTPAALPASWTKVAGYLVGPRANLWQANFAGADLSGSTLSQANAIGANFSGANLSTASLSSLNASGASFSGANLNAANLTSINAFGANFSNATMVGTNVTSANLNATLTGVTASSLIGRPAALPSGWKVVTGSLTRA